MKPRTTDSARSDQGFDLGWFKPVLWAHRWTVVQVLVVSFLIQVCSLITPLFFQIVIDKVLVFYTASTLMVAVVGVLVVGAFKVALDYVRSVAIAQIGSRIDFQLGRCGFERVLSLAFEYLDTTPAGQISERVRDAEAVRRFMTGPGLGAFFDLTFALLLLAVLFTYSFELTLIAVSISAVHVLVGTLFHELYKGRSARRAAFSAASQQFLTESIVGMASIKAATAERQWLQRWEGRRVDCARATLQEDRLAAAWRNLHEYLGVVSTAAILFFGARSVIAGHLTVGQLMSFYMMASLVGQPLSRLSLSGREWQQLKVSLARFGQLFGQSDESRGGAGRSVTAVEGSIDIQNVSFEYSNGTPVLDGISLRIPAGQVIGVIGATGCGKSTLAKLVQRFYLPQGGRILIDQQDIAEMDVRSLRSQIGVVLQESTLFNMTVHDNIALGSVLLGREDVIRAARLAGAHEFVAALPNGYDTVLGERGATLSGGQRQRIAIARAIAKNPRILIFDEATSALDYETERIVQANMKQICQGRTVIIIAHRLAALRFCGRLVCIDGGRVSEEGTHEELMRRPTSTYRRFWALQHRDNPLREVGDP